MFAVRAVGEHITVLFDLVGKYEHDEGDAFHLMVVHRKSNIISDFFCV